jgi:tRNA(fMet)-specific endonuclease VapC
VKYLLDTNICIYTIKKKPPRVLEHLERHHPEDIAISSVTLGELELGVRKSAAPERNERALLLFLAPLVVAPFDERAARSYGSLRADLERRDVPIGALDTMIAAHCLSLGLTLVTNNVREFRRARALSVENWTR